MPFCTDCVFYRQPGPRDMNDPRCGHDAAARAPDPVNGKPNPNWKCHTMRELTACGPDGLLFLSKTEAADAVARAC